LVVNSINRLGAVCPFGLSEPLPCPIRFNPCAHSFHCCRTRLTNLHGTALPTCLIDCRIEHRARRATCCERVNLSCLVPPHIRRRRGDSKSKACGLSHSCLRPARNSRARAFAFRLTTVYSLTVTLIIRPRKSAFRTQYSTISHAKGGNDFPGASQPKSRPTYLEHRPRSSNLTNPSTSWFVLTTRRSNEHLMNYYDVERLSRPILKCDTLTLVGQTVGTDMGHGWRCRLCGSCSPPYGDV
jgi:hypothetical protein